MNDGFTDLLDVITTLRHGHDMVLARLPGRRGSQQSEPQMTETTLTNEISVIESLSKVFAVALGILYLLGFLVVASYLSPQWLGGEKS